MRRRGGWKRLCLLLAVGFSIVLPDFKLRHNVVEALAGNGTNLWPGLISAPWYGSYVCNQGLTRLRLSLRPLGNNRIEADFAFAPDPDNPSVPVGSFRMTGSLDQKTRQLVLKQDRWLEQPADPSYRMIDLEGALMVGDGQAMIRGKVTSYGCQDFAVWQFFAATPDRQ